MRIVGGLEALPEAGAERAIVDGAADLEQPIGTAPRPAHLLRFVHATIDEEVGRSLSQRRANPQPGPVPFAVVDQPIALLDEVAVQRLRRGPQLARGRDGSAAAGLATEVMHHRADAIDADLRIFGLAIPGPPAQALNLLDDHRLRCRALRTIGQQASGNLRQVLQPHGDMKPVKDRKRRDASVEKNAPQPGQPSVNAVSTVLGPPDPIEAAADQACEIRVGLRHGAEDLPPAARRRCLPTGMGEAFTAPYAGRTTANWVDFLGAVEGWIKADVARVYAVVDNLNVHSATDVLLFALAHPRWEFVFQPKYAAYLNLIEPWWKILRSLALKGRRFETWPEIEEAVRRATAYWNAHKHPFVWGRRRRHRPARRSGVAVVPNAAAT